jgi:hypothetical protein
MLRGRAPFLMFVLVSITLHSSRVFSMACDPSCPERTAQLRSKILARDRMKTILSRNEDFLKRNPKANPSIVMKIQSNKIIARLEIETLENEILPLSTYVEKKGCKRCP